MTDQPTKGAWEVLHCAKIVIYLESRVGDVYNEVRLTGPDREANARLFVNASELAEHAEWLGILIKDHLEDPDEDTHDGLRSGLIRMNTILAKIDGGK